MHRVDLFTALVGLVFLLPCEPAEGQSAPLPVLAPKAITASCVTEIPTTSFILETQGDTLVVQVNHHHGTKFVPISSTLVTGSDLPRLNELALMMSHLGDSAVYRFPIQGCKFPDPADTALFVCFPGQRTRVNGMTVEPWTVYTVRRTETSFAGAYEKLLIQMILQIDGQAYSFGMEYAPSECSFEPVVRPIETMPPVR